jgi:hypothetical protein
MTLHVHNRLAGSTTNQHLGLECQCRQSNIILPSTYEKLPGTWICPGSPYAAPCPGSEKYEEIRDDGIITWAHRAMAELQKSHGPPRDSMPLLLLWSDANPMTVVLPSQLLHLVYLQRGSNGNQTAGQLGHEMFHVWRTPTSTHHWVHEMLAQVNRIDFERTLGLAEYAEGEIQNARDNAKASIEEAMQVTALPYPIGCYERLLILGLDLRAAAGCDALVSLSTSFTQNGIPDFDGWHKSLLRQRRRAVERVLQG